MRKGSTDVAERGDGRALDEAGLACVAQKGGENRDGVGDPVRTELLDSPVADSHVGVAQALVEQSLVGFRRPPPAHTDHGRHPDLVVVI